MTTGVVGWLVVFAWSFISTAVIEPTGDGFTRGLNRLEGFFLWQMGALVVALVLMVYGIGRFKQQRGWRWLSRLPLIGELGLVLFVIGTFVVFSQKQRQHEAAYQAGMQNKPVAAPSEASSLSTEADSPAEPPIELFRGVYRSGFESSEFHPLEPGLKGPWWLEADGSNWEALQSHMTERPGRGSSVTVILSFTGRKDTGGEYGHLGAFDTRVVVESITAIRPISEAEYELVLESVR
ncbi:MAG: hypothetical protein R3F07_16525 [Opitutaceae bacterium]